MTPVKECLLLLLPFMIGAFLVSYSNELNGVAGAYEDEVSRTTDLATTKRFGCFPSVFLT